MENILTCPATWHTGCKFASAHGKFVLNKNLSEWDFAEIRVKGRGWLSR
jgi:hypothetical protein